ncbi:apolipoprotein A1/A4/E family protein, partial [Candidatus Babeliales bacterium]|nr:apolipoprotein A1/A4/E family protein [Candidatus Babeliales bacterium]
MKLGQIFKIVLCSFLIQNIQVGFGGEVAEDFSKNFTIIDKGEGLFDIVDDEGNILKDVSKDELDMLKTGRYRTLKSLQVTEGLEEANFLKAGSDEAKTFLEQNDLTQATLDRLRGRTINFSDLRRTGIRGKASEAYSVIELQDVNRAKIYTSKIETLSKSVAQHTTEGLDGLASDLQAVNTGKKSIQSVVSKYKKILTGVSDDNLGRLDVLSPDGKPLAVTSAGKETYAERGEQIRTENIDRLNQLAQNFKSAAGNAVEKQRLLGDLSQACTKIVTDDAMSEIAELGSSIERDSAKLSNMDGQLNSILKNQVEDIQQATGALKLEDFLDDSKKIIKDAAGNDIAVSAIESKLEGLSKDMDASSGQILNDLKQDIAVRVEELSKKAGIAGRFSASIFYRDGALEDLGKTLSRKAQSVTTHDVADAFASAGEKLQKAGGYAFEKLKEVGMVMVSSVLFMLPNIFQSSFLALKQRMVQLETLATPIQFGNWVVQIPASCIDIDNPGTGTIPLYLAVPVQQYGNSLSAEAITHFKGSVGDLTANNSVSDAIHTTGAALFSLGESSHYKISRYSMKESAYLSHNPDIVGTFFAPGGYQAWLSLPVTSSQFTSGEMIALNTGFVADYTGQQQNATAIVPEFFMSYPLKIDTDFDWHGVQPQQPLSPSDVSAFLMQLGAKLGLSDNNVKFTEYVNVNQGSHGPMVNQSLVDSCNCACLDPNAAVCTDHNCMLRKTLDAYQAGLSFNKNGVVGFSNTNVTENKFTNLGSVSSLFGWGESWYPDNINQTTFPGFSYDFSQLMAIRANTTNKQPSANQSSVNFANEAINFAAQGCWVYLSSSTPFARAVQETSSQTSLTGPYVDYIIFLDNQNNIVPLHVPIQKQHQVLGYTSTQLGLNPKIKYWTSIASFYNNQILPMFADQKTGNPIKYDLKGNAWADPNLAGTFSQNTPPGTAVLASAIANLQQTFDGKLFDQFSVHQQAMIDKLNNGPFAFGNNLLVASPYTIQVPGNSPNTGVNITLYRGSTCYASSIDDLFVAFDSQNQPVTLPASDVTSLYSLVTDIAYTVNTDGSLTPEFSNAPLVQNTNGSYSINSANLGTYYYLDQYLESNLEQMQPLAKGASPYVDLCNGAVCSGGAMSVAQYVAQQRTAWSEQFDSSLQKQGVDFGSFICTMPAEFSSKKAVAANAYIYEVVPSPSAGLCDHDLFVISNAANQALASLQPIDAQIADKQSVLISLVTGFVFNTSGTQMMNADGSA